MIVDFERAFLERFQKPSFFDCPDAPELRQMQRHIQSTLETATDTFTVEMEQSLSEKAEQYLAQFSWTLEESINLFLKWLVLFPDRASSWYWAAVSAEKRLDQEREGHPGQAEEY